MSVYDDDGPAFVGARDQPSDYCRYLLDGGHQAAAGHLCPLCEHALACQHCRAIVRERLHDTESHQE